MLELLILLAISLPFGVALFAYAELVWKVLEMRGREECDSLRPLPSNPTEEIDDATILS